MARIYQGNIASENARQHNGNVYNDCTIIQKGQDRVQLKSFFSGDSRIPLAQTFIDRTNEVKFISDLLSASSSGNAQFPVVVGVYGQHGIGKTELILKCAHLFADRHGGDRVAWINASDTASVRDGIEKLFQHHPADAVRSPLTLLQEEPSEWLLVFDNLNKDALMPQYFNYSGAGRVLFSTRDEVLARRLSPTSSFELGLMNSEESIRVLHETSGATLNDSLLETKLVRKLQGLPIALVQAASYMKVPGHSLAATVETLDKVSTRNNVLDYRVDRWMLSHEPSGPYQMLITMELEALERTNSSAAALLRLMSLLATTHSVPRAVFQYFRDHYDQYTIQAVKPPNAIWQLFRSSCDQTKHILPRTGDELKCLLDSKETEDALQCLKERCLVKPDEDWGCTMLEITANAIQAYSRAQGGTPSHVSLFQLATDLISTFDAHALKVEQGSKKWQGDRLALARLVKSLAIHRNPQDPIEAKFGYLCHIAGDCFLDLADPSSAKLVFKTACDIRRNLRGRSTKRRESVLLCSKEGLAWALRDLGQLDQALALHQEVLKRRQSLFSRDDEAVITSRHNVATIAGDMGRLEEAESQWRAVLNTSNARKSSSRNLDAQENLALVRQDRGYLTEALGLLEQVLLERQKQCKDHDELSLRYKKHVAMAKRDLGFFTEADETITQVLHLCQQHLSPGSETSRAVAMSKAMLIVHSEEAASTPNTERLSEAEKLVLDALDPYSSSNYVDVEHYEGDMHRMAVDALEVLARIHEHTDLNQSEREFVKVIELRMQTTPQEEHRDILEAQRGLARVYGRKDSSKDKRAEQLLRKVIAAFEKTLGPQHFETLATRRDLAMHLVAKDPSSYRESMEALKDINRIWEDTQGSQSPLARDWIRQLEDLGTMCGNGKQHPQD